MARALAAAFREARVPAEAITGELSHDLRRERLEDLVAGGEGDAGPRRRRGFRV
jgi:hypothetical protein